MQFYFKCTNEMLSEDCFLSFCFTRNAHTASASVILRMVYYQNSWRQYEQTATLIGNFIVETSCFLFWERTTSFVRQLLDEIDFFLVFIFSVHSFASSRWNWFFSSLSSTTTLHRTSNSLHQFSMITLEIDSDKVPQNSLNYQWNESELKRKNLNLQQHQ